MADLGIDAHYTVTLHEPLIQVGLRCVHLLDDQLDCAVRTVPPCFAAIASEFGAGLVSRALQSLADEVASMPAALSERHESSEALTRESIVQHLLQCR